MSEYNIILHRAYSLYKLDWCQKRGYDLDDWNPEDGFHGASFVCMAEFEQSEFLDEGYMEFLLTAEDYRIWLLEVN